jgi:hypothetical protein
MGRPDDLGRIVELTDSFLPRVTRSVQFLHLPVPIDRDDADYFAPARNLTVPDGAELYVGLLHFRDGPAGAERRIAAASEVFDAFGVAPECGLGRRPEGRGGGADLGALLALHARTAQPVR